VPFGVVLETKYIRSDANWGELLLQKPQGGNFQEIKKRSDAKMVKKISKKHRVEILSGRK
jgi:hypothetical protein